MGAFWEEESPTVVGIAATLEEATVCLGFGAYLAGEIFDKIEKNLEALWVLRKLKSF